MAHFSGQLLSQTLYTCTLLHTPRLLIDVQTPVLLVLRTVSLTRVLLSRAFTITEEDFAFDTSGFTLFDEVEDESLQEEINFQMGEIDRLPESELLNGVRDRYSFLKVPILLFC